MSGDDSDTPEDGGPEDYGDDIEEHFERGRTALLPEPAEGRPRVSAPPAPEPEPEPERITMMPERFTMMTPMGRSERPSFIPERASMVPSEGWLARLGAARVVERPEERERLVRFRYEILVGKLRWKIGNAIDEHRVVVDPEDADPSASLLYTMDEQGELSGALRIRRWAPGQVPPEVFEAFSMETFPDIERLTVAEMGRLVINPTSRRTLPALLKAAYFRLAMQGTDLLFCRSASGLVRQYRKIGLRPYANRTITTSDGVKVPLAMVLSDEAFLYRTGSFLAPMVGRFFGPGLRPKLPAERYSPLFDRSDVPVQTDPAAIWAELEERLHSANLERRTTFLDRLPPELARRLTGEGFIMSVPEGKMLTKAGMSQRELFVLLDGVVAVENGPHRICTLERGEVIGEVAFFRDSGTRSASVRALSACRVLVLRREFLDELIREDPTSATAVIFELSKVLAERLALRR